MMSKGKLVAVLSGGLLLALASAAPVQADEKRMRELEAMVAQLQETLIQVRGEINKMKEEAKSGGDGPEIKVSGGGLSIKSDDGSSFKFGGRLLFDYDFYDGVFYDGGGTDEESSEGEWRRTRLTASGSYKKDWKYKMTINFDDQDDTADINTAYLQYAGLKPMAVTVGKFKEPFLLERLTSSKWISGIERSLLVDALESSCTAPNGEKKKCLGSGQPDLGGIRLSGYHKEMNHFNWALGVFDDGVEDNEGDDAYAVTARLAMVPHFGDDHFLHLGLGYSVRDIEDRAYKVETRLGVHTGSKVTLGSSASIDDVDQYAIEAAYVRGPFSLQAEYLDVGMDGSSYSSLGEDGNPVTAQGNDLDFDGYYAQVAYTLTGETRGYKSKGAVFDKIKPSSSFGAWEVVARYETLEAEDGVDQDAEAEKWLLGLNWYANSNVKFMLNYLSAEVDDGGLVEDDGDAVSLRAQYVW